MLSSVVLARVAHPTRQGRLEDPCRVGVAGRRTDQFIRIELRLTHGCIERTAFETIGCAPAIAAADVLCETVEGLTVDEARAITPETLVRLLDGLPDTKRYVADMAITALRKALL